MSCDNCSNVNCEERFVESVELRLLQNQVNALYGPGAFLTPGSLRIYEVDSPEDDLTVEFRQQNESIRLSIQEGDPVVLEVNNISVDTFSVIAVWFGRDDCCSFYRLNNVLRNGVVICSDLCNDPIDVEI